MKCKSIILCLWLPKLIQGFNNMKKFELHKNDIVINEAIYDRMVYFSKMCAISNCISYNQLKENKTLAEGGCPSHLQFCSNLSANAAIDDTVIEKIYLAKEYELGTGYIAIDHMRKVILLTFRGSSTRTDWLHDFRLYPEPYKPFSSKSYMRKIQKGELTECIDCKVHSGFSKFLKTVHEKFIKKVDVIFEKHSNYNLVISGHSLGAAIAILAGIEFKIRGFNPMVMNYAQPKMFNSQMVQWINELFDVEELDEINRRTGVLNFSSGYYRIIHKNDYIINLPPYFRHAGLQVDIEKNLLPHFIEDLRYNGLNYHYGETTLFEDKNNISDIKIHHKENKNRSYTAEPQNRILKYKDFFHTYEHRNYFVQVNECDYI